MDSILLSGIVGIGSALISGTSTHLLTKKRYNTEVDAKEIENLQASIRVYRDIIEDLKHRMEELQNENLELRKEINDMRKQILSITTLIASNAVENRNIEPVK